MLALISSNADRFAVFVGRFVEKNPGKVLFTAASAPIILANSDAIFGDGEFTYGPDGQLILKPNGEPVRRQPGILPEATKGFGQTLFGPLQTMLYWAGGVVVVLLSLFGGSKVWKHSQKDKLELEAMRNAAKQSITTRSVSEGRPEQND